MSHGKSTAGGKLSEFPRETSQNALNGADVNLEARVVKSKWVGNPDAIFFQTKAVGCYR